VDGELSCGNFYCCWCVKGTRNTPMHGTRQKLRGFMGVVSGLFLAPSYRLLCGVRLCDVSSPLSVSDSYAMPGTPHASTATQSLKQSRSMLSPLLSMHLREGGSAARMIAEQRLRMLVTLQSRLSTSLARQLTQRRLGHVRSWLYTGSTIALSAVHGHCVHPLLY
jgi:hypothetical protein